MDENLCSNLITWLKTFPGHGDLTVSKLTDGVALGNILHTIAPEYFDDQWLSKIKPDVGENWRLKVSNLRKIHQGVMDYLYLTELTGQSTPQIPSPDLNAIVEHEDKIELGRLLQLVLGCAINCEQKERHIEAIMRMEEGIQASIMNAIRDLMIHPEPSPQGIPDFPPQINSLQEQLEVMSLAKEGLERRCNELDLQISVLNEDKKNYKEENERLNERIEILESGGEIGAQGFRVKDLRKQVDKLQDELFKVESSRDEYRSRVENLEKENTEVISKNEELQKLADEARSLKDEVDALRDMSDRVALLEGSCETYKKRLEELSILRKQVKILEEKNSEYMHQIMELEEEVKKSGTWRPQLDLYKKQLSDLHQKLNDESKKTDRQIFENKKLMEKLEAVTQEKERVLHERDFLKETNEEMKLTLTQAISTTSPGSKFLSDSDLDVMGIPPEIREKLRRLQHENTLLKKKASDDASASEPILQSLLNDLQERHDKLLQENRELNQKIMVLEDAKVEDTRKATSRYQNEGASVVPKSNIDSRKLSELERKLSEKSEKVASLEETISKRESEMAAMEERYKKYLNKAKSVIKTLDPKHNPALVPDVSVLRSQLTEKDKIIENMEKESEKSKMIREMEEKLISTAFYNYGMQMHRQMINQRLPAMNNGQSFLNRQRQSSSQRTMRSNVGNSHYYDY